MRDERQGKFHFINPTSVVCPNPSSHSLRRPQRSSREWFPLQGLISDVTKLLKFPYQATDHCISSTNPRVMGNTLGWAATPQDNFHTASSSPKILHVTAVSLLWLQHRACRCSPDAARAGKWSFSCYKHDRAWSAAVGVSRRTSLRFMAAVLTDKGSSSAGKQPQWPKTSSMKRGIIFLPLLRLGKCIHQVALLCPTGDALSVKARCSHAGQHRTHGWLLKGCALCKGHFTASAGNLILFSANINWALLTIIHLCTFQSALSQSLGLMILR